MGLCAIMPCNSHNASGGAMRYRMQHAQQQKQKRTQHPGTQPLLTDKPVACQWPDSDDSQLLATFQRLGVVPLRPLDCNRLVSQQ